MLVLARRASSRIMKPAAAACIQRAYVRYRAEQHTRTAASIIAAQWRAHHQQVNRGLAATKLQAHARRLKAKRASWQILAAIKVQAAVRGLAARKLCRHLLATRIQAQARMVLASRHYRKVQRATCVIQASWQMARSKVVGKHLAGAVERLQAGAVLSKYQQGGLSHERHERFMWLSTDRKKLCWSDPASREGRRNDNAKSVEMETITAVSGGVKTSLMKKMGRRADGLSVKDLLTGGRSRPLEASRAFSLIGRDRVLDLVAPNNETQQVWLRDLRTLLVYGHHLDHKAAVGAIEAGVRRGSLAETAAAAA